MSSGGTSIDERRALTSGWNVGSSIQRRRRTCASLGIVNIQRSRRTTEILPLRLRLPSANSFCFDFQPRRLIAIPNAPQPLRNVIGWHEKRTNLADNISGQVTSRNHGKRHMITLREYFRRKRLPSVEHIRRNTCKRV